MPLQTQVFRNQAAANMQKELRVLIDSNPMGSITQASGKYRFVYASTWQSNPNAIPLSLSMPLALAEHDDKVVRPFMWGLLPESEDTLKEWGRMFHASERSAFDLLSHVGEDLPGAIQMIPLEKIDDLKKREGVTPLSRKTLAEKFRELIRHPGATQFAKNGGRFSLPGAQRKKALYLVNGRWYEPRGRTPSTHILKPPIQSLAGQVENEMFCIRLAPLLGLPAPSCWVENFEEIEVVVIQRYDRQRWKGDQVLPIDHNGGEVKRIHQEDCCQALGIDPRNKYQNVGGPSIKSIMDLLSGSGRPGEDRDRLIRACAYNFVIGGSDAHGKNYSLLLSVGGRFRLAPLYDIASWLPYSQRNNDQKLAMSVDRHYRYDQILPWHWEAEAKACGYPADRAVGHVSDIVSRLPDTATDLLRDVRREGMASQELDKLVDLLIGRCKRLASSYPLTASESTQESLPSI
jgi:serine/threonine-protein kinase HipA